MYLLLSFLLPVDEVFTTFFDPHAEGEGCLYFREEPIIVIAAVVLNASTIDFISFSLRINCRK